MGISKTGVDLNAAIEPGEEAGVKRTPDDVEVLKNEETRKLQNGRRVLAADHVQYA